jgi:hypothetical protein
MLAYWAGAVVLGAISGALYLAAFVLPGGVVLASLTQAPLFIAGLTLGLPAALAASATSALVVSAPTGPIGALLHGLVNAVPVLVLVQRALLSRRAADGSLEWYPPGLIVSWLTGLGLAALGALLLLLASAEGGIAGAMQRQIEALLPIFGPNQEAMRPLFEAIAPVMPGLIVSAWMAVTMANGALAEAIALRAGRAARPAPDIAQTELPKALAAGLVAAAALALLGPGTLGAIGANATLVLTVPFLVLGFAVVHAATKGIRARRLLLGGLYAVTAILTWPVIVIVALGLIDQGFGIKRRFAATRPGGVT